jgi:hypothetical protein
MYLSGYAGTPARFVFSCCRKWDLTKAERIGNRFAARAAISITQAQNKQPFYGNVGHGGAYAGVNTATGTRYAVRGGTATNVYTGNSAAGVRGASYNPNTGVITGGAVGGVKNGSTGEITAGGRGFAYNTNTNTGVAVGNNNVYAAKDGSVYRYNQSTGMQQRTSTGWQSVQRPADRSWVQNQQHARGLGEMRTRAGGGRRR